FFLLGVFCILFLHLLLCLLTSLRKGPVWPETTYILGQQNNHAPSPLAKSYGNIFTMWAGPIPVIVLSGFQAVGDGLITKAEDLADRPETPFFNAFANGKGIILSNGRTWKQQRRFGLSTLRKLGVGKKSMEHQIEEEVRLLVETFAKEKGQPLDPAFPIVNAVANVISVAAFGHRFSTDDEVFHQLVESVRYILNFAGTTSHMLYELFPWLMRYLPGPHKKTLACRDFIYSFVRKEIKNHEAAGTLDDPRDFIDFYLAKMEKVRDSTSTFDEDNMVHDIFDLFLAGSDTTTTTLQWALLYMVNHPDIQEKVQKELDNVLGSSQLIFYEDRKKLPYTNAVIHEIQRFSNIILIGVPRQTVKDTVVLGFPIEKGIAVLPDLCSVLRDPEQWETPQQLNPNHFLDKDGNFVTREAFMPFGEGHRMCLGEQLARTELFLFFTTLLRAFSFRLPEGVKEISTNPVVGASVHPEPYQICAVPR
uniref:Cytochrome P450 family 2 subfamily AB member 14 n=1 Tax=Sphenodon punctatus TaxID=8508 RepID=A0A8D0H9N7_SPHPU